MVYCLVYFESILQQKINIVCFISGYKIPVIENLGATLVRKHSDLSK